MSDKLPTRDELLAYTTEVVSAHLGNNAVSAADVPSLILAVHEAFAEVSEKGPVEEPKPVPAVPIRRSVQPDHLVCLEDGKKLKTLRRHLLTSHGLTPEEYRHKWGLGPDYPMVAPSYTQHRSELAKKIGLGRRARTEAETRSKKSPPAARRQGSPKAKAS